MNELTTSGSLTVISKFGRGVPSGTFSCISMLYSRRLNEGGSSLTSLIVTVASAVETIDLSFPGTPFTTSRAFTSNVNTPVESSRASRSKGLAVLSSPVSESSKK